MESYIQTTIKSVESDLECEQKHLDHLKTNVEQFTKRYEEQQRKVAEIKIVLERLVSP